MVDLVAPSARAVDEQRELLLHAFLADELGERARPQGVVELAVLGGHDLGVDEAVLAHPRPTH